jgi:protein-disulfide isomerase
MEQEILKQVTETLEAQASSKKLSEEAIANITKVFHDAIIQKNDQWQSDKEEMSKEKEELIQASEESNQPIESLK